MAITYLSGQRVQGSSTADLVARQGYDGGLSSMFNFSKETLEQGWMGLKLKM